jgi:hypothetical protein
LRIENTDGTIDVADTRDTKSLDEAAAVALNRVIATMKEQAPKSRKFGQVGFHVRRLLDG